MTDEFLKAELEHEREKEDPKTTYNREEHYHATKNNDVNEAQDWS